MDHLDTVGPLIRLDADKLLVVVQTLFQRAGVPGEDAQIVAQHLMAADLRGIGTHGVTRVPTYIEKIRRQEIVAVPDIQMTALAPGVVAVEGQRGLGSVVGYRTIERLMPLARKQGVAVGLISNAGHLGALGIFTLTAVREGMAMLLVQHTPPNLALPGMTKPVVGNNPIAFGFPGGAGDPVVVDLSCGVVARGNIVVAQQEGMRLPDGWALGPDGQPTNDPEEALRGALQAMAGYKGIALAIIGELLAGVLTNAPHSEMRWFSEDPSARSASSGVGAFVLVIDLKTVSSSAMMATRIDDWRRKMHERAGGLVRVPGERASWDQRRQMVDGITLRPQTYRRLRLLAQEYRFSQALDEAVVTE